MALSDDQFKELAVRGGSSLVIVAGTMSSLYAGGMIWVFFSSAVALLSLAEYYGMLSRKFKVSKGIGFITSGLIFFSASEGIHPVSLVLVLSVSSFAVLFIEIIRRQVRGESFAIWNMGGTISGIVYITIPWAFIILLRRLPGGGLLLFAMFISTWGCDVAAYLIGSKWGHTPLCENISPNKTWEGFIGGFSAAILASVLLAFVLEIPPVPFLFVGLICGFAGQLGDLAESVIKRESWVKDSGNIIPGHGGVLDRFDSVLINGLLIYTLFGVILR
ncbi:MAG: phosphatidate cytidylyltransferase [Synergistaceae bacterium]|nr:phosphatidate cytidylyltransferase [Synergistota bacterium]NLM71650.1 phosphatidate cytidylyltransferase [Synergistaceae bacterium]